MGRSIDLNADVGEGLGPWPMGADRDLIPLVSSVNVACGFHAGDPLTIRRTVRLALEAGVAIGAHPGYPDLVGFGRRAMTMADDELEAAVLYQVAALAGIVRAEGGRATHVKPHGALYHAASADPRAATAVATAVARLDPGLRLVVPPESAMIGAAERVGLSTTIEGFADRVYEPDGRLRSARPAGRAPRRPECGGRAGGVDRARRARGRARRVVGVGAERPRSASMATRPAPSRSRSRSGRRWMPPASRSGLRVADGRRVRIELAGDAALLVTLGDALDLALNARAHRLASAIDVRRSELDGIGAPVPGHAAVLVPFDPDAIDEAALRVVIAAALAADGDHPPRAEPAVHEIRVSYGGREGPDLAEVAARTGLDEDEVVRRHAAVDHRVLVVGFVPGFPYLGILPPELELPRRATPRVRVPAGSVAIAGRQTGIYPFETPGGWHLIGRTDARLWDPAGDRPARLAAGDRVRLVPA